MKAGPYNGPQEYDEYSRPEEHQTHPANVVPIGSRAVIISKKDHIHTAREFQASLPGRIVTYKNQAYRHIKTKYCEIPSEDLTAELWKWADTCKDVETGEKFKPTKHWAGNVLEALAALTNVSSEKSPPFFIDKRTEPAASEIISCENGLLHATRRDLLPHDDNFFNINALPYAYDHNAPEPKRWHQFLSSIWPEDQESQDFLAEMFGYILSGIIYLQVAFMLIGAKRAGKGVIVRILQALVGESDTCGPTLAALAGHFGLQGLIGKKLAVISDARLGGQTNKADLAERLLAITGQDRISVPRKNLTDWIGTILARFMWVSNEVPPLADVSGALASRFKVISLPLSFYGKEDPSLTSDLKKELPGILNWSLDGYDRLMARGYFLQPTSGQEVLDELEELSSPITTFTRECCWIEPGATIECSELYKVWREWCEKQGRDHPGTQQTFGRDLKAAHPAIKTRQVMTCGVRIRNYEGIRQCY